MELSFKEIGEINDVISSIYEKFYNRNRDNSLNSQVAFNIPNSYKIIEKASCIFKNEEAVLQINTCKSESEFVIVGDIHGSLESLIRIFDEKGYPNNTRYLFLGDYVDRGRNSCEVIIFLYALKILYPENIYLIRGNHEFRCITDQYGFKQECYKRVKRLLNGNMIFEGKYFYRLITDSFKYLPICAILDDSIFCVHGGISALINNRKELLEINKVGDQFEIDDSVQAEFLWNDPNNFILGYSRSPRGLGSIFGKNALRDFLDNMGFDLVIRGHQSEIEGYNWPLGENDGILTVFSAIDYCGMSNNGGVAIISNQENEPVCIYKLELNNECHKYLVPQDCIVNNYYFLNTDDLGLNVNIDESSTLIE